MKQSNVYLRLSSLLIVFVLASGQLAYARPFSQSIWQDDDKAKIKPLPPIHYVRSRDFDTKHISLDLRFGWEKEQTFGVEEFTFSPLKPAFKILKLDAGFMIFNSVKLKGGADLKFSYDEKAASVAITLDRKYGVGEEITVVIDYKTKGGPAARSLGFGGGGGLTFVQPTKDQPNLPWQIWAQGESEYNKYWFPAYDYPNDFRTTEMKVTVKKPLMVIGNGELLTTRDNGATRTFHWKMDSPYSNYLTSIVVGEYVQVKGSYLDIPVSTYLYKDWQAEGAESVSHLPKMVKFYSEKLGLKYPYKKYDQTIARNFGGGMENITATTMTEGLILDSRTLLDRNTDGIQAHELAHQWFGDYVTCRDWSEIWLNESFATYMRAMWTMESRGKDAFLFSDVKGNQDVYLSVWNNGSRRPIVTKYYANADAVFDRYAYQRGGAVLHMLRKQLGDENFWRALGHYLKSNANQPVSTEDLRIAIEEATGQSMDAFFDQWVFKMGHPVFEVTKKYDPAKKELTMSVKQVQTKDLTSLFPQAGYFETPVEIEIATSKGARIETIFIKPQAENTYTFSVDSDPLLVDFDNEGTLIKELTFDKTVGELIYQMKNDKDLLGRNWAMDQLTARSKKADTAPPEKALILSSIAAAAKTDSSWQIRRQSIRNIRSIFAPARQPNASAPAPKTVLDGSIVRALLGATKDEKSLVRAEAIRLLGETLDPKFAQNYRNAIGSDKSYSVIDRAAIALAKTKDDDAYSVLRKLAQTDSWKNRLEIAGLNGLTELGDKNAVDLGFKYGTDKLIASNLRSAGLRLIAATGKDDPRTFPLIMGNFKTAFDNGNIQNMVSNLNTLAALADPRGQEAFDLLKAKYKDQANIIGFVNRVEAQFKKAISEKK